MVCINGGQSTPVARFGLHVGIPLAFEGQRWTMIPPAGGTAAIVPTLQTGICEAHGTPSVRSASPHSGSACNGVHGLQTPVVAQALPQAVGISDTQVGSHAVAQHEARIAQMFFTQSPPGTLSSQ
jgi:hypothetical protein